ncbi:MAG: response regulator [Bacteroidota bacterium]|nr:response regulator [Bacteroidota bacterium]
MDYKNIEILLAEDSADDALLTIRALTKSGLAKNLYHVKDGVEALDFIYCTGDFASRDIKERPKVIFLDIKMPRLNGMEVLERLKQDEIFKSIPVVMITSSHEDPDVKKCYALGANSYIVKPVESENFSRAINEVGNYWMIRSQASD